ncbi:putative ribonuclease H-like domain-containing protein [Tanacetum coccineum]
MCLLNNILCSHYDLLSLQSTRAQREQMKMIQLIPASENQQTLKNVLDKMMDQEKEAKEQSDTVRKDTPVNVAGAPRTSNDVGPSFVPLGGSFPDDPLMPDLEDTAEVQNTGIFGSAYDDDDLDTYNSPYADQGTIEEEVYVSQPLGFVDPEFPEKVYKVEKALYGLHQAPRAWYETLSTYLLDNGFYRGQIDKTLFIKRVKGDILLDKYVGEILKKFGFSSIRTTSTPMETNKALTKDKDGEDVDIHLYRSMIGSLMYLTSSRPDIMFSVCACSRFQVQPKEVGNFLGSRLISWQCKKQTVVANSTTEAEYIAASHCCGQVLWIQNQMLDYGYNFMQTKIHVDNESAICVVKNPVYHSKTKHIEIRHHFIRDSYCEKS